MGKTIALSLLLCTGSALALTLETKQEIEADWAQQEKVTRNLEVTNPKAVEGAIARGKVMGTAVGCACGDGVIDYPAIIDICKTLPQDIVFSVECGTLEQAERSIKYLKGLV